MNAYLCWCRGDPGCSNPTDKPFTVCPECARFGHTALSAEGLTSEDVAIGPDGAVAS